MGERGQTLALELGFGVVLLLQMRMKTFDVGGHLIFEVGLGLLDVHRLHVLQEGIVETVQRLEKTGFALRIRTATPTTHRVITGITNRNRGINTLQAIGSTLHNSG